jgi:hypothetical protein
VNLWAGFSPLMMETGEPMSTRSVIRALVDAVERSYEAVLLAGRTLPDRRARSKPAERIGEAGHDVSKPAK